MNREQYLTNLKSVLKESFTQQQSNDILADYSEFFDAGIAEGKSESELCAEFGNPEKIALELLNENISAQKLHFKNQCIKISMLVAVIAILAYSILYLFQNGYPNHVVITFLLAILPQVIISIEISNKHAPFSNVKINKFNWMKKALIVCYPPIVIAGSYLVFLFATVKESLFDHQENAQFFVMETYYLIVFSFLLLLFASVLIVLYSIAVNSKFRWLLFMNVAFFAAFINIRFLLGHVDFPLNMLLTKALSGAFVAFAQCFAAAILFFLFLFIQRRLKAKGVRYYERANEKGNS